MGQADRAEKVGSSVAAGIFLQHMFADKAGARPKGDQDSCFTLAYPIFLINQRCAGSHGFDYAREKNAIAGSCDGKGCAGFAQVESSSSSTSIAPLFCQKQRDNGPCGKAALRQPMEEGGSATASLMEHGGHVQ